MTDDLPADAVVIPVRFEGRVDDAADEHTAGSAGRPSGGPPAPVTVLGTGRVSAAEVLTSLLPESETPVIGPQRQRETGGAVAAPRLARHVFTLSDGHEVGVAVSGVGVPLVVIHGFSMEGFLYAQTLSRLVSMGFKVVAVDIAYHGSTQGLPAGGANFEAYAALLGRVLDELGIERAFLAGHSMGGRIVTQLAATEPHRALGVLLVDAIVGDTWDRLVNAGRLFPPLIGGIVVTLAVDTVTTLPVLRDPRQAGKLARLFLPTVIGHLRRPWRMWGPALSILRSRGSRWMLERLAQHEVPVVVVHGDRDRAVPFRTATSAARRSNGDLVTVRGGGHSWLLRDPETLPGILAELLQGSLGSAYREGVRRAGLDPDTATLAEVEASALYTPDAPIRRLTPPLQFAAVRARRRAPVYEFDIEAADRDEATGA